MGVEQSKIDAEHDYMHVSHNEGREHVGGQLTICIFAAARGWGRD